MNLTIHHGTHQIGGSCIEIKSRSSRIVIDIGIPLTDEKGEQIDSREYNKLTGQELFQRKILPQVSGLYKWDISDSPQAVLISHPHLDHYGLLPYVKPEIPLYMSQGCKELIDIASYFEQIDFNLQRANVIFTWKSFSMGDFKITPYLVDHSAFDAFAYLVEADSRRIFYSGDFRGHGRKSILFKHMIENPPKDIDLLIMEGTMLGDRSAESKSEDEVEQQLIQLFGKEKRLLLIACSSQNIDRIISIYKACKKTHKTFVIIPRTAYILQKINREGLSIPQFDWPNIRVFFAPTKPTKILAEHNLLYQFAKRKISYEEIEKRKNELVILDSYLIRENFAKKGYLDNALLIYLTNNHKPAQLSLQ